MRRSAADHGFAGIRVRRQLLGLWVLAALLLLQPSAQAIFGGGSGGGRTPDGEHIIISGGPALRYWENFRREDHRHDRWWGNFVRTARLRMEEIRREEGPGANITWLVYRPTYVTRGKEDGVDRISQIISVQQKDIVRCKLVWFDSKDDVINYLNRGMNRRQHKIVSFDYFGHSNKHCFTFDYSGEVLGASKVFLHENDLSRLNRGIFARNAECQSWGCHTGESMSAVWRQVTGTRLKGAVGKTDYSYSWQGTLPIISTAGGRWTY